MREKIYGIHAVESALDNQSILIHQLTLSDARQDKVLQKIRDKAQERGISIKLIPRKQFDILLPQITHQGVMAEVTYADPELSEEDILNWFDGPTERPFLFLVLDGVQDPHNLGACLRTAEAAGVHAVIAPKDKAATLTSTVRKVACGATEKVPFVAVTNLARFLRHLKDKGVWCYGLAGEAKKSLYEVKFSGHLALVMGAEGQGLRQLTRELCDELVSIPMQGHLSSVNVSVATGIGLFEIVRQRSNH